MSNQLKMQPTFRVDLPWELEDAKKRLRHAISSEELSENAGAAGSVIDFKIETEKRRFWSPHLSVQLHAANQSGDTEAFCRFSPRPEIWTMVMAIYLVAACFLFAAGILAFVQWSMGNPPWALAIIPAAVLTIMGLHLASLIGQGWSRDQMQLLRSRWDRAIEIAKQQSPETPTALKSDTETQQSP